MNLIDLQDVLNERATAGGAEDRAANLLAGVHHRYAVRRRRRAVAGVAAGVVALAMAGGVVAATDPFTRVAPPPAGPVHEFPDHVDGFRVVGEAWNAEPGATSVTLTFTPTAATAVFFAQCPTPNRGVHQLLLNGHRIAVGDGDNCGGPAEFDDVSRLKDYGVEVGKPTTLELRATAGPLGIAVGENVRPEDYPYPPRPARLPQLDETATTGGPTVHSDPADPNRPITTTVTVGKDVNLHLSAQTPGAVTVAIVGEPDRTVDWWDYSGSGTGLIYSFRPGQKITVTFTPQRMTGAWAASFHR